MSDESWRDLEGPWDRLKWARVRWQQKAGAVGGTAKEAAESLGMKEGTYRAFERPPDSSKHMRLGHQQAIPFAKKFKVSWTWLLTGEGSPDDDQLPEPQERVIRAMSAVDVERQKVIADAIEALVGAARTGTGG